MDSIPALSEKLPRVWQAALNLKECIEKGVFKDWDSLYQQVDFLIEGKWIDAVETVIPGWEKIATQEAGITAKHTLVVLACCMNVSEYQQASSQTRREIEWAALFHDLDKDVLYGRGDGAHGVRSAAAAAQCLVDLGFEFRSDGDFVAWLDLVKSAQKQVDRKWLNDFSHLPAILTGLRYFFGVDTPAGRIIKAAMFHQSMPTVDDWPNPVILNDDEIRASLTLADMNVLGPLMLGDSDAWNVCEPMRDEYMEELRGNIKKVRRVIG